MLSTRVETNSDVEDVDPVADVVQDQPHQNVPRLQLVKTGPAKPDAFACF